VKNDIISPSGEKEEVSSMKVLVVGGGGREHAICWKLAQSPKVTQLYCAPGNAGIASVAQCVNIAATDVDTMVQWAVDNAMDFVVVAPDDPLALGMVDKLEAAGIRAFGPRQNAAILEASKAFSKELMRKYHIPTAKYATFTDEDIIDDAMGIFQNTYPYTVKIDYDNRYTKTMEQTDITSIVSSRSFSDLIRDYYRLVFGCEISEEEMDVMKMAAREAGVIDEAG
jgi:hypothetical protein